MLLSRYCSLYPCHGDPDSLMLFSAKRGATILIPASMLDDIRTGALADEERKTLIELGFLNSDIEAERAEILGFIDELNALHKSLDITVVLNLDCNLACTYCFEGKRKGRFFLSRETANRIVDFIKNRDFTDKKEIKVTFYGGEPLLSTELIAYISEELKSFAESKGLDYRFSLVTNGTLLTAKMVDRLLPLGLHGAKITLDGPQELHDAFRPFTSGSGSFDAIIDNIKAVNGKVRIQIGGNYTRDNYQEFPCLLDYLSEEGLGPDNIAAIKFDPVMRESEEFALPDFNDGCCSINEPWLFGASVFLRNEILRRGYRTPKIVPSPCIVELRDSYVVNYDGALYKCPGLIGREHYCIGTVKDGVKEYRQSHNLDNWKNEECLGCVHLPLCFGGCRYIKVVHDGTMSGIDCKRPFLDAVLGELVYQDIAYGREEEKEERS
ncbi:MAG: geopeptide radical SAM maturase [Nitrospirota bacterium]